MTSSDQPLLRVRGATKRFPGVTALDGVDLDLHAGEVLAVIGENGAGKSTLMKILGGVQRLDAGTVEYAGGNVSFSPVSLSPVSFNSVQEAVSRGISLIHQELNLSDNLDIGANIFLGREPHRFWWIDRATIEARSREILTRVGLHLSPSTLVAELSIGMQQLVEIARALSVDANVLIMDEPTSSLTLTETERLFEVVADLKRQGVAVIYISHRLGEVKAIADRVLVLRDGQNVGELARDEITHDRMVSMMVGRDLSNLRVRKSRAEHDRPLLKVRSLSSERFPETAIDFDLAPGEILGLAGLVGAGRTEVLEALFGIRRVGHARIELEGSAVTCGDPRQAMRHGLALVPEDRKQHGVITEWPVRENLSLPVLWRDARGRVFIDRRREIEGSQSAMDRLSVKASSDRQLVHSLSGGNQQKVAVGKWLDLDPRVLLLDEPTRGVDVGAKEEIYRLMDSVASSGAGVVFASSEMEEVLRMSDRVLVFHQGSIAGELNADELSEEAIMTLATGGGEPS